MNARPFTRVRALLLALMMGGLLLIVGSGCGDSLPGLSGGTSVANPPPAPPSEPASYPVSAQARLEGVTGAVGPVTVNLNSGWNGVGFQCYSVTSLNAPSSVAAFSYWDGTTYQSGPFTMTQVNTGDGTRRGFWVFATVATSFSYSGTDATGASVPLKSGWNLINCPGLTNLGLSDLTARKDGVVVNVTSVLLPQVYEISGVSYTLRDLSAGGKITPGKAYWAYSLAGNVTLGYGAGQPSPAPSSSPGSSPITNEGIVSGQVLSTAGSGLGSVNVTIDGRSLLTNDQGFFSFTGVTPGSGKVASFNKAGCAPTTQTFTALAGDTSYFNTTMANATTLPLNAATGGTVTEGGTEGANITFPANGLVGSGGTPYTGTANVSVRTFVPGNPNFINCFPGEFTGVQNGVETGLISYGYMTVQLTGTNGQPLNLGPGKTATVKIPINAAEDPGTPTIPFWYLNETTGKWDYGGLATRSADNRYYQLTAAHFSSINLDMTMTEQDGFTKWVTVVNSAGEPVYGAMVIIKQSTMQKEGWTDRNGRIKLYRIKPLTAFTVWAEKGTVKSAVRNETAGAAGTSLENTIVLDQPVASITATWGATPPDIDSYLVGPTQSGGNFTIYYSSRGNLNASPYALLNTDDRDGYGPEIVTISRFFPGTYHYTLKVFTTGLDFSNTGLTVEVSVPSLGYIRRYNPPGGGTGKRTWNVFDIVVAPDGTPSVVDHNTYAADVTVQKAAEK